VRSARKRRDASFVSSLKKKQRDRATASPSRHKMIDHDLVIGNDVSMDEAGSDARLREIASRFWELEYVKAVVLAGSAFGLAIRLRSLCLLSPPRERGVSRKPAQASGPKA
jgi:hypothetical protein